ncbi:SDR family oxidoreductase [Algiphilus aromaticivorans]|uniref:SDR family oxidoreductase n=1 Tax=Algiphilus aromaticivorans TaxID=382454 RepID=UPI0005C252D6|nr:SDR family oxidoreductase [Algiphilus aromaticivorans]
MQLQNRVVWITGASGGIGEQLALQASQAGARLVLSARRQDELERVRAACANPGQCAVQPLDLADFDADSAREQAEAFFGPIDILVNNAGISQRSLIADTDMAVYRRLMELDFFAVVALSKAVLPGMVARGGGHVVIVSSVVGYISSPLRSGYSAAKHALHGFFDSAAAEYWDVGVRFTLACPGFVATQVSANALTGDGSSNGRVEASTAGGMDPAECAARIWKAVAAGRYELLMGRERVYVYLKRFLPGLFARLLRRAEQR